MNTLIIAPFPPPFNGNTLPVLKIYDTLIKEGNEVQKIDLNKKELSSGKLSIVRVSQIFKVFIQAFKLRKNADVIYFSITESFLGNVKDLIIYLILYHNRNRIFIHMLGGAGMKEILAKRNSLITKLNKFFISRLGGVIVEGDTQKRFFAKVIDPDKIHVINNFAEDFLFIDNASLENKFNDIKPLKVLYLSNFLYGKGYEELLKAYMYMPDSLQDKVEIDFAGSFDEKNKEEEFLKTIEGYKNIRFHGRVSGEQKKALYHNAHVFCMPTYYPFEGQPFCILEAYASGCVVVVTNHSGIFDVFQPMENGFEVQKQSISSVEKVLTKISETEKSELLNIAKHNKEVALEKHTLDAYISKVHAVLNM
ncbi:UDP-D-galactose:(glucosyl)lipopolysaccharide-1,6-D-galactosyltransferase [compost metagenome]